ncbi:PREDICTED: transient receptor potential cation channel subfamily V member 2-like [Rhinopithecus bieti]|uniref:transient receptor potential cation channel subfamily V member 2-like n=1 Tax=Rhinopithecus bieti TaxID=61621 RepID=UPI00083C21B3|nr:PREDICTED: transient receptor potential cation channel subfamily V member 2-like [Rhinopithecus bieti]
MVTLQIFRHILQWEFSGLSHLSRKFTEWCHGPVRVSLYDLASVDSCEENSVLEIIAFHCKSPHRHGMVVLEPLNKLLQAKWDLLIPRFFLNFLCNLIYMFIFTAVGYHQPALKKARAGGGRGAHTGEACLKEPWGKMGQ